MVVVFKRIINLTYSSKYEPLNLTHWGNKREYGHKLTSAHAKDVKNLGTSRVTRIIIILGTHCEE